MDDQLERRVAALEEAVTDGEGDCAALAAGAAAAERVDDVATTVEDLEDRVAELEAATQALRGYVGNVRSVNEDVEKRADLALSRVERLTEEPGRRQERCEQCGQPTDTARRGQEGWSQNGTDPHAKAASRADGPSHNRTATDGPPLGEESASNATGRSGDGGTDGPISRLQSLL